MPGPRPRTREIPTYPAWKECASSSNDAVNVAHLLARFRRRKLRVVTFQPAVYIPEINLLAPEHSGQGLALDGLLFRGGCRGMDRGVEFVGFSFAPADDFVHVVKGRRQLFGSQPQPQEDRKSTRLNSSHSS